jgi:hypothetical protein
MLVRGLMQGGGFEINFYCKRSYTRLTHILHTSRSYKKDSRLPFVNYVSLLRLLVKHIAPVLKVASCL